MTDFEFFAQEIPNYFVQHSTTEKHEVFRCRSNTGMSEANWTYFKNALKMRFDGVELFNNVNANHVDFTIYIDRKE